MPQKSAKKPLILVVEDERILAKALKIKLTEADFAVNLAYDGEEAISALNKKKPDLILLDILLPKMTGIEFLREARKRKVWKNIPVIVISNYTAEGPMAEVFDLGVVEYLIKSDTPINKIVEKIKKITK